MMELSPLQRFERARQQAQSKMSPNKGTSTPSTAESFADKIGQIFGSKTSSTSKTSSNPTSIQDLIRNKQNELGFARPNSSSSSSLGGYNRTGQIQSTTQTENPKRRPLGNYLDLVG